MAMAAGSVTIADDGTVTKSGMAATIFDEFVNNYTADVLTMTGKVGVAIPGGAEGVPIKRGYAVQATRMATAIVTYITANAKASIPATGYGAGLQRDPATSNNCLQPSAEKLLTII